MGKYNTRMDPVSLREKDQMTQEIENQYFKEMEANNETALTQLESVLNAERVRVERIKQIMRGRIPKVKKTDTSDVDAELDHALEQWKKALKDCQEDHDTKLAAIDITTLTPEAYTQQVDKVTKEFNDKAAIIERKTDEVKERFRLRGSSAV